MPARATIRYRYMLIAALPALVFIISQLVLREYGQPLDELPERLAEFDVFKEGGARISMLAAFMLFVGGASAALLFFVYTLKMLDWFDRGLMAMAMVVLALSAIVVGERAHGRGAEDYIGKKFACVASDYTKAQSDAARSKEKVEAEAAALKKKAEAEAAASGRTATQRQQPRGSTPARPAAPATETTPPEQVSIPPGVLVKHVRPEVPENCSGKAIERMRDLEKWQVIAVVFAFSALVFGAICCLAKPVVEPRAETSAGADGGTGAVAGAAATPAAAAPAAPAPAPDPELQHWEAQSEWLNTYLYLSALLLWTVLLFLNAYLRWPAFALVTPKPYEDYTSALLAFYGFTFTVMLAAFYIPVAVLLSSKVKARAKTADGAGKLPDAFKGPVQLLKILLGLFSTALAGTVPGILDKLV